MIRRKGLQGGGGPPERNGGARRVVEVLGAARLLHAAQGDSPLLVVVVVVVVVVVYYYYHYDCYYHYYHYYHRVRTRLRVSAGRGGRSSSRRSIASSLKCCKRNVEIIVLHKKYMFLCQRRNKNSRFVASSLVLYCNFEIRICHMLLGMSSFIGCVRHEKLQPTAMSDNACVMTRYLQVG